MQSQLGQRSTLRTGFRPFTAVKVPLRPSRAVSKGKTVCLRSAQKETASGLNVHQQALLSAFLAFSSVFGLPMQAEAKKEEPPPKPTAYDELQKIITGRSGKQGSLIENFKNGVTQPVKSALSSAPKLPAAPTLTNPKKSEPASKPAPPKQAAVPNPVKAIEKRVAVKAPTPPPKLSTTAQEAVQNVTPGEGPPPALLGVLAAIGLGGFALFSGKKGDVRSGPKQAARRSQANVKAGTNRIGAAAKRAAKQAPPPLKNAFGTAKAQVKKPTQAKGGLFAAKKASAKVINKAAPAVRKLAPTATKKIRQAGTARIGTQRAGTQRVGTKRTGGAQGSRRLQLDEDTSTTLGAASVFGLGVVVSAILVVNVLTGTELPAAPEQAVEAAASKLPKIPAPLPVKVPGSAPGPTPNAPPLQGQTAPTVPRGPLPTPQGPEFDPQAAVKPRSGLPLAPPPAPESRPQAPSQPDLFLEPAPLGPPQKGAALEAVKEAPKEIASAAKQAAPELPKAPEVKDKFAEAPQAAPKPQAAVQNVAQAAPKPEQAVQNLAQAVPKPQEAIRNVAEAPKKVEAAIPAPNQVVEKAKAAPQAAPLIPQIAQAVPAPAKQAQQAVPDVTEIPQSAAFEAAAKKLQSAPSAAQQFKSVTQEPAKTAKKATGSAAKGVTTAASKASPAGPNALILGGLAVAAVAGIAVAAPKGGVEAPKGVAEALQNSTDAFKGDSSSSAGNSSGSKGGSSTADIKDDIANRKKETKEWIEDWRKRTGGE